MRITQITIKDIARELGISPSTVSRALKDHPDISKETKKAVNELAEKLNYQPNSVALNLRTKKTNTIGVIIPELVHFFFSTVISGIEDVAYQAGYNVILAQSNESLEREKTDAKALFNSRVDGMLISISRETTSYDHLEALISKGLPIVFYDRLPIDRDLSHVIVDDYVGAKEAVEHLISQGCSKIAHLQSSPLLKLAKDRLQGHMDALTSHNLTFPENYLKECPNGSIEDGFMAMEELLSLKDRPDAIFANNDLLAMGAIKAIKKARLNIPKDLAVVGFSNWLYSSIMDPPLSSVNQPGFIMGQEAVRMLIRQIEAKEKDEDISIIPESLVLKTHLVIRESSIRKPGV